MESPASFAHCTVDTYQYQGGSSSSWTRRRWTWWSPPSPPPPFCTEGYLKYEELIQNVVQIKSSSMAVSSLMLLSLVKGPGKREVILKGSAASLSTNRCRICWSATLSVHWQPLVLSRTYLWLRTWRAWSPSSARRSRRFSLSAWRLLLVSPIDP